MDPVLPEACCHGFRDSTPVSSVRPPEVTLPEVSRYQGQVIGVSYIGIICVREPGSALNIPVDTEPPIMYIYSVRKLLTTFNAMVWVVGR